MKTPTIANQILAQLGGNRFITMVGAKELVDTGNGMLFKFGRNSSKFNYLKIELDHRDLYTMTFYQIRKAEIVKELIFEGIYNDGLIPIFEDVTHMATSL